MSLTETSVVARRLRRIRSALRSGREESRLLAAGRRLRGTVGRAVGASVASSSVVAGLDRIAGTAGRWIRGARCYRWLTAEPDPEIVVIDLRETYTAGPVIAALDRAAEWAVPRWRGSAPQRALDRGGRSLAAAPVRVAGFLVLGVLLAGVAATLAGGGLPGGTTLLLLGFALLATRERRSAAALRETVPGRALAALLTPPEPPTERDPSDDGEREPAGDRAGRVTRGDVEPEGDE